MEKDPSAITVLIVDDQEIVRACIKEILQKVETIKILGEANSGEEAIEFTRVNSPDIILMDIKMPGMGGLEAARTITQRCPNTKIIALTSCDEESVINWAKKMGITHVLHKGMSKNEFIAAIQDVHLGKKISNQKEINVKISSLDRLNHRELQIMFMICSGAKVRDIAKKLFLADKTVNSYRYSLQEKLNVQNDVELTHLAIRCGLLNREIFSYRN